MQMYFKDDKDNYVRMVWSQSNNKLDYKFNMLLFFHKANFNNELFTYIQLYTWSIHVYNLY